MNRERNDRQRERVPETPAVKAQPSLYQRMTAAGVAQEVAAELARQAAPTSLGALSIQRQDRSLARQLVRFRMVAEAASETDGRRCVVVVGPPGAGKTTVLAKLAAAEALGRRRRVGLVSLDQVRVGALEHIRRYAELLGLPLECVAGVAELRRVMTRWTEKDLILVDTPGIGARQAEDLERLNNMLAQVQPVSIQLVLSASDRDEVCRGALDRFGALQPDGLIVTRLDECPTAGPLVHAPFWSRIPLTYISDGPEVPEDLTPATAVEVVRRIVTDPEGLPQTGPEDATAEDPPVQMPTSKEQFDASYVANNNSDIFHRPECKWTTMIKKENALGFASVSEARSRGFKPCRYCSPDKVEADFPPPSKEKELRAGAQR